MRRLAAIMFTDIEGFTKLMQHNETEALKILERHKQIYVQYTKHFKGQFVKYLGDGTLTIFSSAIQAVKCSIALQQALQKAPSIPVRIGIHQGDIILENKDVIGDAVNLASRIQPFGIPGSILISEKVFDELQNHDEIKTIYLGGFTLKNISYVVKLYAIVADGLKVPNALHKQYPVSSLANNKKRILAKFSGYKFLLIALLILFLLFSAFWLTKSPETKNDNNEIFKTIAVLPFANIGSSDSNNSLADGLTEEMVSLLSLNEGLKIKKITSSAINNNERDWQQLLKEINVGSVLEGKVEHDKDTLLIFANLINASNNQIIWSNTYHRQFKDLMKVQEEVALQIADALNTHLTTVDIKNFAMSRTYSSDAYLSYVQGRYAQKKRTAEFMREAIFFFNKALQQDTSFALAYSGIADTYTISIDNGYIPYDSGINLARNALNHAFSLDSNSAEIRASKAIFLSTVEGKRTDAMQQLKLSLSISPNYAAAHQWYALELAANGEFDSALLHIDKAIELEPFSERIWLNKCLILDFARKYQDAINLLNNLLIRFPDNSQQYLDLKTDCLYQLGQKDSVLYFAAFNKGALHDYEFWQAVCNNDKEKLKKRAEKLNAAMMLDDEALATYYVFAGDNGKALNSIENAYQNKEFSWLKYLNVEPTWDLLRKEPRFQTILSKLGF